MTVPMLRELLNDPAIADLIPRWFQRPRGAVKRTIDVLCAQPPEDYDDDGNVIGLPSNKAIAEQLGISEHTVRQHIEKDAALKVSGLPRLNARSRVYMCDLWDRIFQRRATPPSGSKVA